MKLFITDYEWNGETWWQNAKEAIDSCPVPALAQLIQTNRDDAILTDSESEEALSWINSIEGADEYCNNFSSGPFNIICLD